MFGRDLQDVCFLTVVGRDPTHIGAARGALIAPGKHLVRNVEVIGPIARQIHGARLLEGVVALDAVLVQDRLDDPCEAEALDSPLGLAQRLRGAQRGRGQLVMWRLGPRLVAADATLHLARHQMGETPHPLHGTPPGI